MSNPPRAGGKLAGHASELDSPAAPQKRGGPCIRDGQNNAWAAVLFGKARRVRTSGVSEDKPGVAGANLAELLIFQIELGGRGDTRHIDIAGFSPAFPVLPCAGPMLTPASYRTCAI
jgi:hypothetical protein